MCPFISVLEIITLAYYDVLLYTMPVAVQSQPPILRNRRCGVSTKIYQEYNMYAMHPCFFLKNLSHNLRCFGQLLIINEQNLRKS